MKRMLAGIVIGVLGLGISAHAQVPDPNPGRFAETIETFTAWDRKNAVPEDVLLFVGSSSVQYWETAVAFPGKPVINRGLGGSELSDFVALFDRVIKPYSPRKIFLYAGDNDIAAGKPVEQVVEDFDELATMVHADLPNARLIFLSIKPSKARWDKWPLMAEANRAIRVYAAKSPGLGFVDVATPLLDDYGFLRDVYVDDGLHLNEQGYRLWETALAPYLE